MAHEDTLVEVMRLKANHLARFKGMGDWRAAVLNNMHMYQKGSDEFLTYRNDGIERDEKISAHFDLAVQSANIDEKELRESTMLCRAGCANDSQTSALYKNLFEIYFRLREMGYNHLDLNR